MSIVVITRYETDAHLIKTIAVKRGLPVLLVAEMLRYNIITANQLVSLTGLSLSKVMNKVRPGLRKEAELIQVGAFPEWDGKDKIEGRLFILRNDQTEKLLRECNGLA